MVMSIGDPLQYPQSTKPVFSEWVQETLNQLDDEERQRFFEGINQAAEQRTKVSPSPRDEIHVGTQLEGYEPVSGEAAVYRNIARRANPADWGMTPFHDNEEDYNPLEAIIQLAENYDRGVLGKTVDRIMPTGWTPPTQVFFKRAIRDAYDEAELEYEVEI